MKVKCVNDKGTSQVRKDAYYSVERVHMYEGKKLYVINGLEFFAERFVLTDSKRTADIEHLHWNH